MIDMIMKKKISKHHENSTRCGCVFRLLIFKEQKVSFIKSSISLKLTHKGIEALFLADACFRAMP